MLPTRVSLTSNIMFNYDDDGAMSVLGAGARGVDKKEREIDSSTAAVQQHAHLKIYIGWREIRDGHCFSSSSMAFFSRFFSIFFFFFFFIPFHSLNRFFSSSLSKYQK